MNKHFLVSLLLLSSFDAFAVSQTCEPLRVKMGSSSIIAGYSQIDSPSDLQEKAETGLESYFSTYDAIFSNFNVLDQIFTGGHDGQGHLQVRTQATIEGAFT